MVAYSFQKRFIKPIQSGVKRQTLRLPRGGAGHAVPGKLLQLYYAMRTKHCRKIVDDVICTATSQLILQFEKGELVAIEQDGRADAIDPDVFAVNDGFQDQSDFSQFWEEHHGTHGHTGPTVPLTLIQW